MFVPSPIIAIFSFSSIALLVFIRDSLFFYHLSFLLSLILLPVIASLWTQVLFWIGTFGFHILFFWFRFSLGLLWTIPFLFLWLFCHLYSVEISPQHFLNEFLVLFFCFLWFNLFGFVDLPFSCRLSFIQCTFFCHWDFIFFSFWNLHLTCVLPF